MNQNFKQSLSINYTNSSQKTRVMSEDWTGENIFLFLKLLKKENLYHVKQEELAGLVQIYYFQKYLIPEKFIIFKIEKRFLKK